MDTAKADKASKVIAYNITCVETNNAEFHTSVIITFDYV